LAAAAAAAASEGRTAPRLAAAAAASEGRTAPRLAAAAAAASEGSQYYTSMPNCFRRLNTLSCLYICIF